MHSWTPDISGTQGPKYLAIAKALSRDIEAGVLSTGDRLPPQRILAQALGVDLTTVTRAYGEAQRLGLVEGNGRRGSFIRAGMRSSSGVVQRDPGDLGMNAPPEAFGGSLAAAYRDCANMLLMSQIASTPFQYQRSGGSPDVREIGAGLLGRRAIPCNADTVLVTAGGQNALHAIFSSELRAGDGIAVCDFVYPGLLSLARRFGVELLVVASDSEGMLPDALDAACSRAKIRAVYVVPTNDNPTTRSMGSERRRAIAATVEKHGLIVIEDDAYGFLPESPLHPVAALAPDRTWHISSTSKILTPGLRIAFLRAPDVASAWRLAANMHETAVMAPPLNAFIVSEWIRTGLFDRLVGEVRQEARRRQEIVRDCLSPDLYAAQPEGYHLWVPLGGDANFYQISEALRQHGMAAISGDAFSVARSTAPSAVRISIGGSITQDRLRGGLRLLSALIAPDARPEVSLV